MIQFAKYQSLENDFCVIGQRYAEFRWSPRRVAAFCHRRRGIGADGLIVLGKPGWQGTRFRLFNADGSRAEWSGNGVRCAALFLAGPARKRKITLQTVVGTIELSVMPRGSGQALVSFDRPMPGVGPVGVRGRRLTPHNAVGPIPVDAGNPHWIFIVPHFDFPWAEIGLSAQKLTPGTHGVNVEFVRVLNRRRVEMRIFERGVGPTPSSGSGALAAVAACSDRRLAGPRIRVLSPGGEQMAQIERECNTVRLTALTHHVFSGAWKAI